MTVDPVTLFRYPALTFNGHRVHYDYRYATGVEGYPDLVGWCREKTDDRAFASSYFCAKRPQTAKTSFEVTGGLIENGSALWLKALTMDGAEAMEAGGTFAEQGN